MAGKYRLLCPIVMAYILLVTGVNTQARVVFTTEPAFPRIYPDAEQGVFVCRVRAYDEETNIELTQYRLARLPDTGFFTIKEETGEILTSDIRIEKIIGEQYELRVYGVLEGTTYDMGVSIMVSRRNIFTPTFTENRYTFSIYKDAQLSSVVGTVKARDQDPDEFNKNFLYSSQNSGPFSVLPDTGDIILSEPLLKTFTGLEMTVSVSDQGVPPLSSNTSVTIRISSLPAPVDFCNSMTNQNGTVCWKVPQIVGQFDGFLFAYGPISSEAFKNVTVSTDSIIEDEACVSPSAITIGERYVFYIWTTNGTDVSQRSRQGSFTASSTGEILLVGSNCSAFNVCNVVEPCANRGQCVWVDVLKYTCRCAEGWQGENCQLKNPCSPNPCSNNGSCVSLTEDQYRCDCGVEYFGDTCQHQDICLTSPCENDGTCSRKSDGGYVCTCTETYKGQNCEQFDPCNTNPCLNGGDCVLNSSSDNGFTCDCSIGYSGNRCDIANQCITKPDFCQNGGTCFDQGNGYALCECPPQFTGRRCESFNACSLLICQNNSTCIFRPNNQYKCVCQDGYYGQECQHYNLCSDKPCLNGGNCTNTSTSFTCNCHTGYSGSRCELFDPCHNDPCERGGICQTISNTDFNCTCSPETFGKTCSFVNSCKLDFCTNGATCENTTTDGGFKCHCAPGFYGEYCSEYDPCVSSPCLNGGNCLNISSQDYNCSCPQGYAGKTCSYLDPCQSNPCFNSGRCKPLSSTNYSCVCPPNFLGSLCEMFDFCSTNPCGRGGQCELIAAEEKLSLVGDENTPFTNITNSFVCNCLIDYTGILCETALGACLSQPCQHDSDCHISDEGFTCICREHYTGVLCETKLPDPPCQSNPCQNGASCEEIVDDFYCNCSLGFQGKTCEDEERCPEDETQDGSGRYTWPSTGYGVMANLYCALGPPGMLASRRCGTDGNSVKWLLPDTSSCTSKDEEYAAQQLQMLKSLTSDPSKMGPGDVANVAGILEFVFEFSLKNEEIATDLVQVVSNVMEVKEDVLQISQGRNQSSQRMVELIGNYTSDAEISPGMNVTLVTDNINVLALDIAENSSDLFFSPKFIAADNKTIETTGTITLPSHILENNGSSSETPQRIEFSAFKSAKLFLDSSTTESTDTLVLSASLKGRKITNLSEPIVLQLPENEPNRNYTCKFWNETENAWSTEGVETIVLEGNITQCLTYHLTSFAILMDPSPDFQVAEIHDTIQTYITYIGCAISMLGLTITIITFAMFRCLHGDKSGKILLNMCVSLLLLNIVFILGSQRGSNYGQDICMVVAVLIHYFLLTSLMWMCVEAGNMYRVLVTVFTKYTSYFMLKRCIAAWGIPAVIVGITLGVSLSHYQSPDEFCFISHANVTAFYVSVLAPACLIIIINIVVFIMVSRVIMKPRFTGHINAKDTTLTAAQVRGAFAVMVLLGVAWVFGPLAINEAKLVFSYIFCIANAFQGFLIFIFRCFINPEARAAWVQLIKTGTFKRKRGPHVPTSTSTASKGDSKGAGTPDDSKRNTMVLNENVWHTDKYIHKSDYSYDNSDMTVSEKLNSVDSKKFNGQSNGHSNGNAHGLVNGHSNGHTKSSMNTNGAVKSRQKPKDGYKV